MQVTEVRSIPFLFTTLKHECDLMLSEMKHDESIIACSNEQSPLTVLKA